MHIINDMRKTKIVCTLGPACDTQEKLEALIKAGMNVARLNMSHATHDYHANLIKNIRYVSEGAGQAYRDSHGFAGAEDPYRHA